jgi:hypothetical protein
MFACISKVSTLMTMILEDGEDVYEKQEIKMIL